PGRARGRTRPGLGAAGRAAPPATRGGGAALLRGPGRPGDRRRAGVRGRHGPGAYFPRSGHAAGRADPGAHGWRQLMIEDELRAASARHEPLPRAAGLVVTKIQQGYRRRRQHRFMLRSAGAAVLAALVVTGPALAIRTAGAQLSHPRPVPDTPSV